MRLKQNNIGQEGMIIHVFCNTCDEWIDESDITVTNIREDWEGRDVLSFLCPDCDHTQESFRVSS